MTISQLGTFAIVLFTVSVSNDQLISAAGTLYTWRPLRIGAGGYITGLDISPDGATRVIRTDTYGGYVWNAGLSQWVQVVTSTSMPTTDIGVDNNAGIYEIRVAPSLPTRVYMSYRGFVYRSDDRAQTWTKTAFAQVSMDANDDWRGMRPKMAVDPANPDVVYVGTPQNGLYVTADGGTTWTHVAAIPSAVQRPNGQYPGILGIVVDPSEGTTGGKTTNVYAGSYGNGVWRSTDAGSTWTQISGGALGGVVNIRHGAVSNGMYYSTSNDGPNSNIVWKYTGSWANISPSAQQDWHSVTPDPFDANRVVLASGGGYVNTSHDAGSTWDGPIWNHSRQAPDIAWLAWTQETHMSNGDLRFDPVTPNLLWFAEGIGVWYATVSRTPQRSITWTSQSRGIEQLVANSIAAPPGGVPVLASWDRALFTVNNPDVFPSQHGPTSRFNMGWHVDYASTDPTFLVGFVSDVRGLIGDGLDLQSSYSTDGGQTWTRFPMMPLNSTSSWNTFGFGTGAVSTPDNFIWVPSNKRKPYYTKDRAQSWQRISLPGVPDTPDGWTGLHWAYYLNRHIVTADRVTAGTFYMYHTPNGLYRSTDGGSTWGLVHAGEIAPFSGFNAKLRSVPGHAGHLFFTSGQQDGSPNPAPAGAFMRSKDGGVTWTAVPNVLEVYAFGFGKEPLGGRYPTIFIAGWVGGVYGIWRSDNGAQSWTQIGDFPLGSLDAVKAVDGDKTVYGAVYLGFNGSGYAYGRLRSTVKQ